MIKEDQVKSFNEKGYLVIENLLPDNILKNLTYIGTLIKLTKLILGLNSIKVKHQNNTPSLFNGS